MRYSKATSLKTFDIRQIAIIGVLAAVSIVLGQFGWGFIMIPGLPAKITIMHIPVIIGAIIEGPIVGAMVGLLFGIFSLIQAFIAPTPLSFAFMNPLVSVVPRIIIGITTYLAYRYIKTKYDSVNIGIAAAVGTMTNTTGVLGMIYLLYAKPFAESIQVSVDAVGKVILSIVLTNGIPEVIAAIFISLAVVRAIKKVYKK